MKRVKTYTHGKPLPALLFDFKTGSSELRKEHEDWIKSNMIDGKKVTVLGLASALGNAGSNMTLSKKRALSVKAYIEKQFPSSEVTWLPIGETFSQFSAVNEQKLRSVAIAESSSITPTPTGRPTRYYRKMLLNKRIPRKPKTTKKKYTVDFGQVIQEGQKTTISITITDGKESASYVFAGEDSSASLSKNSAADVLRNTTISTFADNVYMCSGNAKFTVDDKGGHFFTVTVEPETTHNTSGNLNKRLGALKPGNWKGRLMLDTTTTSGIESKVETVESVARKGAEFYAETVESALSLPAKPYRWVWELVAESAR